MVVPKGQESNIAELRVSGVSAHYVIDNDGEIYQLVPDQGRAWMAGVGVLRANSKMNSSTEHMVKGSMNDKSIGIMCVNDGNSALTDAQKSSLFQLDSHLAETYKVRPEQVVGLGDWALGRHIAPGWHHPWGDLHEKTGLGLWSNVDRKSDPEVVVKWKAGNPVHVVPEDLDHIGGLLEELSKKCGADHGQKMLFDLRCNPRVEGVHCKMNSLGYDDRISALVAFNIHHKLTSAGLYGDLYAANGIGNAEAKQSAIVALWDQMATVNTNTLDVMGDLLDGEHVADSF